MTCDRSDVLNISPYYLSTPLIQILAPRLSAGLPSQFRIRILFSENNIIMPVQWHEENLKRLFLAVLAVNRVDSAAVAKKWLELYGEYGRQSKYGRC